MGRGAALSRWLTPWRLRVWPLAAGFAATVALVLHVAGVGSGRVGGDLPGFLAAGRLVATPELLYDPAAQARAQADLVSGGYVRFAYPPYVAAFYTPLASLPLRAALAIHVAVSVGALFVAARRMGWRLPAVAAVVAFYPMLRAIGGGQNTAFSLLCVCGAMTASTDVRRGVWLGLWLFKPQLALPVLLVVALVSPRVLLGAVPVAAAWWVLGAAISGTGWVTEWWSAALRFAAEDRVVDLGNSVSIGWFGLLVVPVLWRWRHDTPWLVATSAAAVPLVTPHALYYDVGIALAGLGLVARHRIDLVLVAALLSVLVPLAPGPVGSVLLVWTLIALVATAGAGPGRSAETPARDPRT